MVDMASDTTQTITAVAAHIANNRESFKTEGQRTLFLIEELVSAKILSPTASREEASVLGAAMAAHAVLEVRARDIKRAIFVVKASINGDKLAKEAVDGLRLGKRLTGDAAYSHWKRAGKQARGEKVTKRKKALPWAPKSLKLTSEDRAWILAKAKKIKREFKTSGQRSIAMNRALVKRGVANASKAGGPTSPLKVRRLIAKTLGINAHELGLGMTILRREASGAITPGAIEAIESGRYESCGYVVDKLTGRGRKAYIEEAKTKEWLEDAARGIASNMALLTPGARSLAYLEHMVEHKVLDPLVQVSRQMKAVCAAAAKLIPGVVAGEVTACWAMVRAIARKELPAHTLDGIRAGVETASRITSSRVGGVAGLVRAFRAKGEFSVERLPTDVVDLRLAVATAPSDVVVEAEIDDPVAALHDFASEGGAKLDRIIAAAEAKNDTELVRFAEQFRDHVGLYKMQASKLRNRRSATRAGATQTRSGSK